MALRNLKTMHGQTQIKTITINQNGNLIKGIEIKIDKVLMGETPIKKNFYALNITDVENLIETLVVVDEPIEEEQPNLI